MLNQFVVTGRLTKNIELKKEEGKEYCVISLAISRSFKNSDGTYDTDFIECIAFDNIAQNTSEYCTKGDIVGVKGKILTKKIEKDDETVEYKMELIAEKVTFLTSSSRED